MRRNYIIGYIVSLILTIAAFTAVYDRWLEGWALIAFVVSAGFLQVLAQLYFFLHLQDESQPRWRLWAALFTALILAIVIGGSLWIMKNLDYNMQHRPEAIDSYMLGEANKGF